jgi:hypothetical protein
LNSPDHNAGRGGVPPSVSDPIVARSGRARCQRLSDVPTKAALCSNASR